MFLLPLGQCRQENLHRSYISFHRNRTAPLQTQERCSLDRCMLHFVRRPVTQGCISHVPTHFVKGIIREEYILQRGLTRSPSCTPSPSWPGSDPAIFRHRLKMRGSSPCITDERAKGARPFGIAPAHPTDWRDSRFGPVLRLLRQGDPATKAGQCPATATRGATGLPSP